LVLPIAASPATIVPVGPVTKEVSVPTRAAASVVATRLVVQNDGQPFEVWINPVAGTPQRTFIGPLEGAQFGTDTGAEIPTALAGGV